MSCSRDPRRFVHTKADVTLIADARLAGMQAHPHSDGASLGPRVGGEVALRVGGRSDCVLRASEGDEERISLRVHFAATVRGERGAQDPLVVRERVPVARAELLQHKRRALDVREEEGDGAAWELEHTLKDEADRPKTEAQNNDAELSVASKRIRRAPVTEPRHTCECSSCACSELVCSR